MAMLAKCAGSLRGGDRYEELTYLGCPADLAALCVRPMVWSRLNSTYNTEHKNRCTYAWLDGQCRVEIPQLDWIEYIPSGVSLADCGVCCGIPVDHCMVHGTP